MSAPVDSTRQTARQLETLESLLAATATDLKSALVVASDLVARALGAEKVDVFLYEAASNTLVAVGSSSQPLSALQKKHGLDRLPVANGGRTVEVYLTGETYSDGNVDADGEELRGIRETLSVRSQIGVALDVGGERRGALLIASTQTNQWGPDDARFAEAVARWVAAVVRQAELVARLEENALAAGRRAAAEELVTILAHDLRNVIYPIELSLQLIQRRAEREQRPDDVRDAANARRGLGRLNGLITEILDTARLEQGAVQLEARPVGLVPLMEEVATVLGTPDHPVTVKANEDVTAFADPARLRQCIENLVSNAQKHSPKHAEVFIRVFREPTGEGESENAVLEVLDQGAGVPPDLLPHLFERFVRGTGKHAGLGLGLFIARQIALLHGGSLTVESQPGSGARFRLVLPREGVL